MSKTKNKILDVSRALFNEFGYSQVTIRMIALKLGMSSGNLNYHFKKREEILEALYFEMVSDFDERIVALPKTELSLLQVKNDIEQSMDRMVVYKFIWTDLFNILRANDKIHAHFYKVHQTRLAGNLFLFNSLCSQGLMRSASFQKEYDGLADQFVNFGNTWMYVSELYHQAYTDGYMKKQVEAMLGLFYPYLTQKGVEEFRQVVPNWFED